MDKHTIPVSATSDCHMGHETSLKRYLDHQDVVVDDVDMRIHSERLLSRGSVFRWRPSCQWRLIQDLIREPSFALLQQQTEKWCRCETLTIHLVHTVITSQRMLSRRLTTQPRGRVSPYLYSPSHFEGNR